MNRLPKVTPETFDSFLGSLNDGDLGRNVEEWLKRLCVENPRVASLLVAVGKQRRYGPKALLIGLSVYALLARQMEADDA